MTMKDALIKWTLTVGLLITSYLLFQKGCDNQVVKDKFITKTDTLVTHKTDTIWAKDTTYILVGSPTVVDSLYIHDTINANPCDYIRTYKDTLDDTNLTIYSDYVVRGSLIGTGSSYKLKVPLKIVDSTLVTINSVRSPKMSIYAGVQGGYKTFGPYIDLNTNRYNFGLGYDFYSKVPNARFGVKLFQK